MCYRLIGPLVKSVITKTQADTEMEMCVNPQMR